MFGRVAKFDPFDIGSCFGRGECFVERPFCVRIQAITNQDKLPGTTVRGGLPASG